MPKQKARSAPSSSSPRKDDATFASWKKGVQPLPERARRVAPAKRSALSVPRVAFGMMFSVESSAAGAPILAIRIDQPVASARRALMQSPAATIDLHGLRSNIAEQTLERFVRDIGGRGISTINVIHGRGAGVLRDLVWDVLMRPPLAHRVAALRVADATSGGEGATVVLLARSGFRATQKG